MRRRLGQVRRSWSWCDPGVRSHRISVEAERGLWMKYSAAPAPGRIDMAGPVRQFTALFAAVLLSGLASCDGAPEPDPPAGSAATSSSSASADVVGLAKLQVAAAGSVRAEVYFGRLGEVVDALGAVDF